MNLIGNLSRQLGIRLYLIVDEYDNFTNDVLNTKGQQAYHELTHGTGIYRELFKKFKPVFDRIIMLGVSPITLDDLTSGYNIALNITMDPRFNQMLGFSEDDVRQMIRYYKEVGAIRPEVTEDSIIADMKPWYDNYCFAKDSFGRSPEGDRSRSTGQDRSKSTIFPEVRRVLRTPRSEVHFLAKP